MTHAFFGKQEKHVGFNPIKRTSLRKSVYQARKFGVVNPKIASIA
ncbi:hypothetical protein B4135_0901 [Caldibacillus debilis]|uniref:Uncharacterized protein n=1 Tax=Caldibacillus debilis TaxID=301148 RepID=A0A150M704_9BACI|nr:hypothetical protein B4135_0901 [Caldibacillus debilis]